MKFEGYDKFEYMTLNIRGMGLKRIIEKLNKYGQDGWEVISEIPDNESDQINRLTKPHIILKRKIYVLKDNEAKNNIP